eukprot:1213949-Rhodomonas_salina.1
MPNLETIVRGRHVTGENATLTFLNAGFSTRPVLRVSLAQLSQRRTDPATLIRLSPPMSGDKHGTPYYCY